MQRFLILCLLVPMLCFLLQSCQQKKPANRSALVSSDPELNQELGDLFMAKNKLKPGIVTTQTGLQYYVIRNGMGGPPSLNDSITVYYKGQFINGKTFDDQHFQRNPITLKIPDVNPGWQQALLHMQPGAIWIIYVPPRLAYGQKGLPGQIPGNQTLVYTINMINFKKG